MLPCTHFRKRTQIQIYHDSEGSIVNVEKERGAKERQKAGQTEETDD